MRMLTCSGVGGVWESMVGAFIPGELDELMASVRKAYDGVNESLGIVAEVEAQLQEASILQAKAVARFGISTPFNLSALMVGVPIAQMQAELGLAVKRVALLDLCYSNISTAYDQISRDLDNAGLADAAVEMRSVSAAMALLHDNIRSRIYSKRADQGLKERQEVNGVFRECLLARGLELGQVHLDGYFDALSDAVRQVTGVETASASSGVTGMGALGIAPAIVGLIKVIIVVAGVVASLALITGMVRNMYAASNAAMDMVAQQQQRKTNREAAAQAEKAAIDAQVAAGKLSPEEAAAQKDRIDDRTAKENQSDAEGTGREIDSIVDKAKGLQPNLLGDLVLPLAIGAGVLILGIVLLK